MGNNRTATSPKPMGGFKLKWQLLGSTNNNEMKSKSVWKIRNRIASDVKDVNMMTIMNLVRESKIHGVNNMKVWKTLLKHRWDIEILKTNSCLRETQVADAIYRSGQDLNLKYDWNLWIPEEDLAFGTELYSALFYCPKQLVESAKLSVLFESLLTNQSLNTVVAATLHNIQPRAGDNIKDFTSINMWYQSLDVRYNFSLGSYILPLLKTDNLTTLESLHPPYLQRHKDFLDEDQPKNKSTLIGKDIKLDTLFSPDSSISNFSRGLNPSEPSTSLDIQLEFCIHPILCLQDQVEFLKEIPFTQKHKRFTLFLFPSNNP